MAIVVNYVSKVVLYFHICVTKKSTKSLLQEYNLLKHTFVDAANFWIKENQKEVILGDYLQTNLQTLMNEFKERFVKQILHISDC